MAKKTIKQAVEFAAKRMEEKFRGQTPDWGWGEVSSNDSSARLQMTRTFNIQVAVDLNFSPSRDGKVWMPVVRVNAPAINCGVVAATAFFALVQDATLFAATLQAQLDEFEIPFE